MPTFLWFYVAGLAAALGVGFVFYAVLGAHCHALLERLFGERGAAVWGRAFRMLMVTCAVVGGLSTQWYGCEGYTDYDAVARDRRLMVQKSTEQVAGAIRSASGFVLLAAGSGALAYAFLWRGAANPTDRTDRSDPTDRALPTDPPDRPDAARD